MENGKYPPDGPPDPAALFVLQNQVAADANVLAFQKHYGGSGMAAGGKWGFDVFYESLDGSEGDGLTCESISRGLSVS